MPAPFAIRTEGLRKKFGDFVAVRDVSLSVAAGETFGLLGPNGAGKSTFIRMLTTVLEPSAGRALVAGHDVQDDADEVRKAIGVIPQAMTSDPELTAAENLEFFGRLYGVSRGPRRRLVTELLKRVDLTAWRDHQVGTFSGGMRRRLEIARGLMHQPSILFLDEPTTGLDPASRQAMWEMIRGLQAETGLTVFLTTHYMEEADQLCDRLAIFDHGTIVAEGTPAFLKARVAVSDVIQVGVTGAGGDWPDRLAGLPGVVRVETRPDYSEIESRDRFATVAALLAMATEAHVTVTSLVVRGATLEDVFLQHTGRDLRDDASGAVRMDFGHLYEYQGGR